MTKVFDNFLVYKGTHHSVYFHAENARSSDVYEYYKRCDMPTRANLLYLVKRLADHGRIYDLSKFRIENKRHKIYAFKAKGERFFCFFWENKLIIITSAYRKRGQKADRKDLRKAIQVRELYC
jgi:hypothetical protein